MITIAKPVYEGAALLAAMVGSAFAIRALEKRNNKRKAKAPTPLQTELRKRAVATAAKQKRATK